MLILDGKVVSSHTREILRKRAETFRGLLQRPPQLTVILVGEDPASQVYVQNKHKACAAIGMDSEILKLPAETTQEVLEAKIHELNRDSGVDGVLVQLPLPKHLSSEKALAVLDPRKDADGLTETMVGRMWAGRGLVVPCTPRGVMKILEHYGISVKGKKAVVVGRSQIVGKPMVCLLTQADATVTLCHSKTHGLQEYTKSGEIVVVAAGKPGLLGKNDFQPGAIVIDVGIHRTSEGKIVGDVRYDEVKEIAGAVTPVPGGVGPMTITCLLENTLILAEARAQGKW